MTTLQIEINHTFGTKTKHNVPVVQNIMKTEISRKLAFFCSLSTADIATPNTHMMVTLYTDIPTYLLSFKAGIWTFLVSHARNAPKSWNNIACLVWSEKEKLAIYFHIWKEKIVKEDMNCDCYRITKDSLHLQKKNYHLRQDDIFRYLFNSTSKLYILRKIRNY